MKRKTLWILIPTLAVGLLVAPIVWAHQQMHSGEKGGMAMLHKLGALRQELNLTDDQVNQIRAIAKQTHEANRASRASFHENFVDAGLVLLKNPDDIDAAQSVLDKNEQARAQMRSNVLHAVSDAIKVLTPEQRAKLATKLQEGASQF